MIEAILVGVGVFGAGQLSGRYLRRRARPKPAKPQPPIKPICGCSHHYSMHDPQTGECHAETSYPLSRSGPVLNDWKDKIIGYKQEEFETRRCACRRYAGPEPLPEFYAPEIAS